MKRVGRILLLSAVVVAIMLACPRSAEGQEEQATAAQSPGPPAKVELSHADRGELADATLLPVPEVAN
jgi:hypothetical protein